MARRRKRVEIAESILTKKGVDPAEFYRGRRKNRLVRLAKRVGISREEFLRMIDEAYNEDEQNEFKS